MATATQKLPCLVAAAVTICDLPADLLLKILVPCGPIATAHVSMVLSVLVRAEVDGRRLVDAVAVALIRTFSDELSCEHDARWPWLYHAARLMGLLPNKPHPVWLLSTPNVPRVPPSWFLRSVFHQQAAELGNGWPIDLTVLRKMYAIFGMPYTDPAHSQPTWLSFEEGENNPVGWLDALHGDLAGTPLARFLTDLGQFLHKLESQTLDGQPYAVPRHVSADVFDAALSIHVSNEKVLSHGLLEAEKELEGEDDDSEDDDYEPEEVEEVEEEYYPDESEDESEDPPRWCSTEHGPGLFRRLALAHGADPTCCHGPCRCTLVGPLDLYDRVLGWERDIRTGRLCGRYWDDDLRLARFLAHPSPEKLSYFLDDGQPVPVGLGT